MDVQNRLDDAYMHVTCTCIWKSGPQYLSSLHDEDRWSKCYWVFLIVSCKIYVVEFIQNV